jgi:hypothetical protein
MVIVHGRFDGEGRTYIPIPLVGYFMESGFIEYMIACREGNKKCYWGQLMITTKTTHNKWKFDILHRNL